MRYSSAGDSHSKKITVIVEGVPYGVPLSDSEISFDLARRRKCYGRSQRQEIEKDECLIVSGVSNGKTTGSPVCIEIQNMCSVSEEEKTIPRPGHADLPAALKYGQDDLTFVRERASARETACRVAAGVIAKNFLEKFGVEVYSFVTGIGSIEIQSDVTNMQETFPTQTQIETNNLRCPDVSASEHMSKEIDRAMEVGETLGGTCRVVGIGLVPGLASYNTKGDRIDATIGGSILSIPSVKSVSFGSAKYCCCNVGSITIDQLLQNKDGSATHLRSTNYCGGIEGGMTNGMPLVVDIGVKPVPTVSKSVSTIDLSTVTPLTVESSMRHDTCVVPSVGVIAEAEIAIVIANEYMKKFGCDTLSEIKDNFDSYVTKLKLRLS